MYDCVAHRRSAVGIVDTSGGGQEPLCLGCMVDGAAGVRGTTIEADSVAALQTYDVVQGSGFRLFFANNWERHRVRCECSCAHEAPIPYLEAAIRAVHLMCSDCISAGHQPSRDD
jgi:hypothetical protein